MGTNESFDVQLNVHINSFTSVIDNCGYLFRFPQICSSGEFPKAVRYWKKLEHHQ